MNPITTTNASAFIPHWGCPHKCAFCNKNGITELAKSVGLNKAETSIDLNQVEEVINSHAVALKRRGLKAQIAFFGGTFTALNPDLQEQLLLIARRKIEEEPDLFTGVRCSTRPDYISEEALDLLKKHNVSAIELGAQSMDDEVLVANMRGHTAEDVRNAAKLIKNYGFELGLQMMTGLYKDTLKKSLFTADEIAKLAPATARIYPTVIMKNTKLGELFLSGEYKTFSAEETIELCAEIYGKFVQNNIRVIRIGLNYNRASESLTDVLGGNFSPVMGELCIGRYYFNRMKTFMESSGAKKFKIFTDKRNISKINGHKSGNKLALEKLGFTYKIKERQGADLNIEALY